MAVVLQKNTNKNKGLIVLSHREKSFFDFLYKNHTILMNQITEKYIIVVHVGWVLDKFEDKPYISKVFAAKGNIINIDNIKDKVLPISSREFIPKMFKYENEVKDIDLVIITNAAKHKKPSKIIDISVEMLHLSKQFKAFFIVTFPSQMIKSKFDIGIEKRFWENIPFQFRSYFSFLSVYANNGLYPLPRWFIAKLYKSSKYYVHTCEKEGESRAIGEALLAKNIVLAPHNLEGAARTLVEKNPNCYFYKDIQEASNIVLMDKYIYRDQGFEEDMQEAEKLFFDFYINNKLGTKVEFFKVLQEFDLSMALPGHIMAQYTDNRRNSTADLESLSDLENFLDYINIENTLNNRKRLKIQLFLKKKKLILMLKTRLQPIKVYFDTKS